MSRASAVLAAFAGLVFLLSPLYAQQDPFEKDDHKGDLPAGAKESGVGRTFRVDVEQPDPLSCNTSYFFRAVSHDSGVNCATYDFNAIYDQASDAAVKRAEETRCKSGPESECKTPRTWRAWHHWDCKANNAYAIVVFGRACPKSLATFVETPKVRRPKHSDLKKVNPPNPVPQPGTTEDIDLTGGPQPYGCTPPNIVAKYEYKYAIKPRPKSLEPYVDQAEKLARAYSDSITCAPPCTHQPYKAEKIEWSYDGTYVIVDVWLIPCK